MCRFGYCRTIAIYLLPLKRSKPRAFILKWSECMQLEVPSCCTPKHLTHLSCESSLIKMRRRQQTLPERHRVPPWGNTISTSWWLLKHDSRLDKPLLEEEKSENWWCGHVLLRRWWWGVSEDSIRTIIQWIAMLLIEIQKMFIPGGCSHSIHCSTDVVWSQLMTGSILLLKLKIFFPV